MLEITAKCVERNSNLGPEKRGHDTAEEIVEDAVRTICGFYRARCPCTARGGEKCHGHAYTYVTNFCGISFNFAQRMSKWKC